MCILRDMHKYKMEMWGKEEEKGRGRGREGGGGEKGRKEEREKERGERERERKKKRKTLVIFFLPWPKAPLALCLPGDFSSLMSWLWQHLPAGSSVLSGFKNLALGSSHVTH